VQAQFRFVLTQEDGVTEELHARTVNARVPGSS
jgi:hypothetical protein